MLSTRLTRLPKSLARSALYRSTIPPTRSSRQDRTRRRAGSDSDIRPPNVGTRSDGRICVAFDFDIFSPPTSSQPCTAICRGRARPADISIAGQRTA